MISDGHTGSVRMHPQLFLVGRDGARKWGSIHTVFLGQAGSQVKVTLQYTTGHALVQSLFPGIAGLECPLVTEHEVIICIGIRGDLAGERGRFWMEVTPGAGTVGRISACGVFSLFFCCCIKYLDRRNLIRKEGRKEGHKDGQKDGRVSFSSQLQYRVHHVGALRQQELEAALHAAPTVGKQR